MSNAKANLKGLIDYAGNINSKLIRAVVKQFGGWESFISSAGDDVVNHGIDGGFGGFIYYSETHDFAIRNRSTIVELLEEQADSLGEDVVSMVAAFGVFRHSPMDADDKRDLYKYLGGGRPSQGAITNAMAWFAAEEVCRAYSDFVYELSSATA